MNENINDIKDTIDMIKNLLKTQKVKTLKNNNLLECKEYLQTIFPSFSSLYPTLFNNIVEEKDLSFLNDMFKGLEEINQNNNKKEEIEKELGEKLAEKYLYPNIKKK